MSADSFSRRYFDPSALFGIAIFMATFSFCSSAPADDLHGAATNGNVPKANPGLISNQEKYQDPPLITAISDYHPDEAKTLIYSGADIEAADYNDSTPLNWAAARGYKDVVELLLARGAKVDAPRKDGITPLIWASNKEVAELLVEHGADVNARDEEGRTPLLMAEASHDRDWVDFLLAHGAKVDFISSPGLWLRIHSLWLMGIGAAAIAGWLSYFWPRRKVPAPSWKVRLAWWFGFYLAGCWSVVLFGIWRLGFFPNLLSFVIEPLYLPASLTFLLPDSWRYALFEHLPTNVAIGSLDLVPYGIYLLLLALALYVKRLQTFCFLLVLLAFLIFLSAFGLQVALANWPVPD